MLRAHLAGSGYLTFDEFRHVSLVKLGLKLSESALRALWCALDADDNNQLRQDEMGPFLRLAPTATSAGLNAINAKAYRKAKVKERAEDEARAKDRIDYALPTSEMRAALEAEGVALPDDAELGQLSTLLCEQLMHYRDLNGRKGLTWFSLFQEIDLDSSGYVTFDELTLVVRRKLQLSSAQLSDERLRALWCRLDADESNSIMPDEMAKFLKGKLDAFLRKPALPPVLHGLNPKLSQLRSQQEMEAAGRRRATAETARTLEVRQAVEKSQSRLAREESRLRQLDERREANLAIEREEREAKRRLLSEMRLQALRVPVSTAAREGKLVPLYDTSNWSHDHAGRPASRGRLVPLYESERLVSRMQGSPLGGKFQWPGPAPRLGPWASAARGKDYPRELLPPMGGWLESCRTVTFTPSGKPPSRPPTRPGLLDDLSRSNPWRLSPPLLPTSKRRAALQASSVPAMLRTQSQYALGWRPSYEAEALTVEETEARDAETLGYGDAQAARWGGHSRPMRQSTSLPALVAAGQPRSKVGRFDAYM